MKILKNRFDAISGSEYDGDYNRFLSEEVSFDTFCQAVLKHYAEHGPTGTAPKERYDFGMLSDIIGEAPTHDRVIYLTFEVTIPAGGTADIGIALQKEASYDFHCGGDDTGIDGWDMVTTLGSTLTFTRQTAAIAGYEDIEIVRQNFGFDPKHGITTVLLDPQVEHYWMDVRKK